MNVFIHQLVEVEDLSELPENATIHAIDGKRVSGICGVCHLPVFSSDTNIEQDGNYWHTDCVRSMQVN